MTLVEFSEALVKFSRGIADRYQEDGLDWEVKLPVMANYPWYYVDFTSRDTIHLQALQTLESKYRDFMEGVGGAVDGGVTVSAVASGRINVRVKVLWNERRPKSPDPEEYHQEGCDDQYCACSLCGACQYGNPCICYAR